MNAPWHEWLSAVLVLACGLCAVLGALGLVRFKDFFQRLHAPALGTTLGTWCAAGACVLFYSNSHGGAHLQALLIPLLLALTTPVTTLLLARTALFRQR